MLNRYIKRVFNNFSSKDIVKELKQNNQLQIGAHTYGYDQNTFRIFNNEEKIIIGKYCSIAKGVIIFGGGEHDYSRPTTFPFNELFSKKSKCNLDARTKGVTTIGNDVWMGANAIILSGVTVADGCVIGAGSVVSKDTCPYSIVVGNPMRILKQRFDIHIIEKMMSIKWWEWSEEKIKSNIKYLTGDINEFIVRFAGK